MKKTDTAIIGLDSFDESISLWQLLPTKGSGLQTLKHIVDAELNCQVDRGFKPLSLFITGITGKLTYARAFLRALGIEFINEIPSVLLNYPRDMVDFLYASSPSNGYIISNAQFLREPIRLNLYQLLTSGEFDLHNQIRKCKETYPGPAIILITAMAKEAIPKSLFKNIEYHIELGEFNQEGLILATLQRIKYCNLGYESEDVLCSIVEYGYRNIESIVKFLKLCILLLRKQNGNEITMKIVERASKLIK